MDQHLKSFVQQIGFVVLAALIPVIFSSFASSMTIHIAQYHTPIQLRHMT